MNKSKLKAFVRYGSNNKLISSIILLRTKKPAGEGWDEVPATLCCSAIGFPDITNRRLKAFAKYDRKGFIIPSSLTVRDSKPKKGTWKELPYDRCCTFYNAGSVTLTPATATITVGATTKLTATVLPADASDKTVSYSSSNAAVATVSQNGTVTGVSVGSATITVTTNSGGKTATSKITVKIAPAVNSVTVTPPTASKNPGTTQQATAAVAAVGGADDSVTWSTSLPSRATVNASGLISIPAGATAGNVTITATSVFDNTKKDTCVVTVVIPAAVTSVTVAPKTASITAGEDQQLTPTVVVTGGAAKTVTYSSSSNATATVSASGLVTGVAVGSATITVTSTVDNTKKDTAVITVVEPA